MKGIRSPDHEWRTYFLPSQDSLVLLRTVHELKFNRLISLWLFKLLSLFNSQRSIKRKSEKEPHSLKRENWSSLFVSLLLDRTACVCFQIPAKFFQNVPCENFFLLCQTLRKNTLANTKEKYSAWENIGNVFKLAQT